MIVAKTAINLYTALSNTALDSLAAKEALDAAGVTYTHLFYVDPQQQADVLAAVSTWRPTEPALTAFPFLVYDERHDDYSTVRKVVVGKAAILSAVSDLAG